MPRVTTPCTYVRVDRVDVRLGYIALGRVYVERMNNSEQSSTDLRDQLVQSANFILHAIDRLNGSSSSSSSISRSSDSNTRPPPLAALDGQLERQTNERVSSGSGSGGNGPSRSRPTPSSSAGLELSRMFNWTGSGSRQTGDVKRKQPAHQSRGSKKKKLNMYKHTFVCLASMTQE